MRAPYGLVSPADSVCGGSTWSRRWPAPGGSTSAHAGRSVTARCPSRGGCESRREGERRRPVDASPLPLLERAGPRGCQNGRVQPGSRSRSRPRVAPSGALPRGERGAPRGGRTARRSGRGDRGGARVRSDLPAAGRRDARRRAGPRARGREEDDPRRRRDPDAHPWTRRRPAAPAGPRRARPSLPASSAANAPAGPRPRAPRPLRRGRRSLRDRPRDDLHARVPPGRERRPAGPTAPSGPRARRT